MRLNTVITFVRFSFFSFKLLWFNLIFSYERLADYHITAQYQFSSSVYSFGAAEHLKVSTLLLPNIGVSKKYPMDFMSTCSFS